MNPLENHSIPEEYFDIEVNKNEERFADFCKTVQNPRMCQQKYVRFFESLIYFTEANESKHLRKSKLEKVKIYPHSNVDQVVKIEYDVGLNFF